MKRALAPAVILAGLSLSPAAHARHTCAEVSDIVGRQKCSRYGSTWSTEESFPIAVGLNASYLSFATEGRTFKGGIKVGSKVTPLQYDGSALGKSGLGSGGIGVRITVFPHPVVYLGLEYGITLGRNQPMSFSADGATYQATSKLVDTTGLSAGGLVGLRLPLGPVSVRGELFVGGYGVNLYQSVVTGALSNASVAMAAGVPVVEPRVAVDLWTTPWLTLSGSYGRNVLDRGSQLGALSLTFHGRGFDGESSFF